MNSFLRTVLNLDGTEDWSEDKMELKERMYVRFEDIAYRIGGQN